VSNRKPSKRKDDESSDGDEDDVVNEIDTFLIEDDEL